MKNEVKAFSFYRSYYECLKDLRLEDQKEMVIAMINFVFEDKKPTLKGVKKTIWTLLEPNLNTSKNRSNINSGAPVGNRNALKYNENSNNEDEEKNNQKTIKKQSKNNQSLIDNHMNSLSLSLSNSLSYSNSNIINNNILNNLFIEYIKLREDNKYIINETVIKRLLDKLNEYGESEEEKKEIIEKAINGGWKDFYKIESKKESGVHYETV